MKRSALLATLCLACASAPPAWADTATAESWSAQIEASLAATARQLDADSIARRVRVDAGIQQLKGAQAAEQPVQGDFSTLPGVYRGGSLRAEGSIKRFEHTEKIRMGREAP